MNCIAEAEELHTRTEGPTSVEFLRPSKCGYLELQSGLVLDSQSLCSVTQDWQNTCAAKHDTSGQVQLHIVVHWCNFPMWPNPHWTACVQCGHSHSPTQVPFTCIAPVRPVWMRPDFGSVEQSHCLSRMLHQQNYIRQLLKAGQLFSESEAKSTQDVGRDASNIFPLMLLACSVDTPIHINRFHLLAWHCALRPASCVD